MRNKYYNNVTIFTEGVLFHESFEIVYSEG